MKNENREEIVERNHEEQEKTAQLMKEVRTPKY